MKRLRAVLGFAAPFVLGVSVGVIFRPARPRTSARPATWALVLLYVDEIVLALLLLGVICFLSIVVRARRRAR